ncbi:Flp pilus assembly protein CpaB [Ethanoligenens sp.]|uniref:Flp pilus assembly protein CpaB n=1 Tax=Ethanoligenens sp. TaxID=2099655 RepID=UPI0039E7F4F0
MNEESIKPEQAANVDNPPPKGKEKHNLSPDAKKRIMVSALSIGLAVVVGFGGVFLVNELTMATVPVVRARELISQGTQVTSNMIEIDQVSKYQLQSNVTGDPSLVVGAYATTDILPQDNITGNKLTKANPVYTLADNEMLMSVPVKNLSDALAGQLKAGDIVRISALKATGSTAGSNNAGGQGNQDTTPTELQFVRVAAVAASDGQNAAVSKNQSKTSIGATTNSSTSNLPASVTLYVNQQQISRLTQMSQSELIFALVYRGGGAKAQTLLDEQTQILQGVQQ